MRRLRNKGQGLINIPERDKPLESD
ncbi:hypothetical protein VTL71DRAFT_12743 [Oculimacula yallundae]|uniref:Uncharacterized protein n=1 Tax=Oculimacula yallundae TaxID=86028 RepID=A0ABR4CNB7_9HELO